MRDRFHTSGVRWHIADDVPFQRSFEGCIEKYNKDDVPVRYSAVAYWYLAPGGRDPFAPVPLGDRQGYCAMPAVHHVAGAIEGEDLPVLKVTGGWHNFQDLSWWAKDRFSGDAALSWTKGKPGDRLVLGGWDGPLFPGPWWFLGKVFALVFAMMWFRWTFPRVRFDQLLNVCWKWLIPLGLANLCATALVMKLVQ